MNPGTVTPVEHAVAGKEGDVRVRREPPKFPHDDSDGDVVTIKWFCGDELHFAPKALESAIAYLEDFKRFDAQELWVDLADSHGYKFTARLAGADLVGKQRAASLESHSVPWEPLKRTLRLALSE